MSLKSLIRKIAKFVLNSQPEHYVNVNVAKISSGSILKNKKILITGGGSGLGLSMAKKFISEGAIVLIVGRDEKKLKNAIKEIDSRHCRYLVWDVCEIERASELIKTSFEYMGGLDCVVSNAGISLHENHYKNVTIEGFDRQFNTKFKAGYFIGKAFLEFKLSSQSKLQNSQLLYITSETGNQAYDTPYGLTNSALNSLIGAFSRRVYKSGIRVNAIAPGVTLTEMTKGYTESIDGNLYRKCASGRTFLPDEIAEVANFILSDASKCISGEIIHCNAGNHIKAFWDE